MEGKEISITYETLFELLRREKNREELQTLSPTFYQDIVEYLITKNLLIQKKVVVDDLANNESRRILIQMDNTGKIIRELYERREKKIILLAINRARTGSSLVDTSTLLHEERKFYDDLLAILESTRQSVLCNLLNAKLPDICPIAMPKEEPKEDSKIVRFIHSVPKFIGTELETYGPFEQDDVARLPNEIASVLISKGRAEEIAGNE